MKERELIFGLMAAFGKEEYSIADFLHLLAPFQVSESSLRTNLSRMTQKGLITSRREGRNSVYRFSGKGGRVRSNVGFSFTSLDWSHWDRSWWGIVFSVPDTEKEARHAIRKKLTAYRFTPLYPGFWIRPFHPAEDLAHKLGSLFANAYCRAMRFSLFQELTQAEVTALWKLDEIAHACEDGLALITVKYSELSAWSPEQALVERMEVGGEVIPILFRDPLLPPEFLPANWQFEALREAFAQWDRAAASASQPYWERIFSTWEANDNTFYRREHL